MFRKEVHAPFDTAQSESLDADIARRVMWCVTQLPPRLGRDGFNSIRTYFKNLVDRDRAADKKRRSDNVVDDMTDLLLLCIWKCINTRHACSENNASIWCYFWLGGINERTSERTHDILKIIIMYRIFYSIFFCGGKKPHTNVEQQKEKSEWKIYRISLLHEQHKSSQLALRNVEWWCCSHMDFSEFYY